MMSVGSRDSCVQDAKTNLPLVVGIVDICDESRIKTTLVAVHHKHGDGTIWSVWKKIKFIEISQFRNKNLTIDTHHSRNIAPSTSYSFFLDLIRSRRNPLGSLLSVGTCLDFSVE
mmetsp:Transcript_11316/g.17227  ORF Transcript_11316/g.17227 Transcript_11316/m.17227 type:complete len:115 (+) Transcript_11316:245-589(+)